MSDTNGNKEQLEFFKNPSQVLRDRFAHENTISHHHISIVHRLEQTSEGALRINLLFFIIIEKVK